MWNLTPHFTTYTLSKAGLWTLTQTLALALAPAIRVVAVCPGPALPSRRQTEQQFAGQGRARRGAGDLAGRNRRHRRLPAGDAVADPPDDRPGRRAASRLGPRGAGCRRMRGAPWMPESPARPSGGVAVSRSQPGGAKFYTGGGAAPSVGTRGQHPAGNSVCYGFFEA